MWTHPKKWKSLFLPVILATVLLVHKINAEPDPEVSYTITSTSIEFFVANGSYTIQSVTCKSSKGEYNGSEPNICENLEPCTLYSATLVLSPIEEEDEQGTSEQVLYLSTLYATPEVELTGVHPGQFSMRVEWTARNRSCISTFEVIVSSSEQEFTNKMPNDEDKTEFDKLSPCQTYDVQLKTTDVNGAVVGEPIVKQETTDHAEPDDVTGIKFEPSDEEGVKVSWNSPKYKTCIDFYYLKWTTKSCLNELFPNYQRIQTLEGAPEVSGGDVECKWSVKNITDANTKEYLIRNLDGCEDFVLIFYINHESDPKSDINEFQSPEKIPGGVILNNEVINSTNINATWAAPQANKKCVKEYILHLVGPLQLAEVLQTVSHIVTNVTFNEFVDLDPCGEYNISIYAVSLNGTAGDETFSTASTSLDKPSKIRNVQVTPYPKALGLQWDPPEFAELCLDGYRITAWNDSTNHSEYFKETNDTNVTLENLISCQFYTIQIIPYAKNMDGPHVQIEQITSPMVAAAPDSFQSTVVRSHSIELSARVRDDDYYTNKCQILFAQFECSTSKDVPYKKVLQYVEGQVGDVSFRASMSPLSPFTDYICKVNLYNTAGWSDFSQGLFVTDKYYPEEPVNISVKSLSTTSIRFQWEVPQFSNGNINVYVLYFRRVQAAYYISPKCYSQAIEASNTETTRLESEFASLQPYSYYSFQIAAKNDYGTGDFTLPTIERTLPSISDAVTAFQVIEISGPDVTSPTFKANVVISWQLPCKSNGEIDNFQLEFLGSRTGYDTVSIFRSVKPDYSADGLMSFNETDLKPEYQYQVYVSVVNKDVQFKSETRVLSFQSPSGVPEKMLNSTAAKVDAFEAKNPTSSAVVTFPVDILTSTSGTIMYAAILISQKNCNADPELLVGALDSAKEWPDSDSWMDAYNGTGECIKQYQTTPIRWQPVQTRSGDIVEYTIGTEICTDDTRRYCNGPLRPDTEYRVVIRLFTRSSYSDALVMHFKTDSLIKLTLILITIISCLLVAFVAGFLYLYITKKIIWHRESGHGIEDAHGDITPKNFATFFSEVSKRDKLQREFKELTVIATDFTFSASEANEYKNRYRDIFPYDKNRVILDIDADGNDYINASFINGYRRKKEYIATQGPKQESTVDFWRMVLQHNVRIIVMVTQFKEEDVVKCYHYYPWEWKDIKVEVQKEEPFDLYDRREMIVTHAKQNIRRKIVHFFFKKWPDHGVPEDPMSLITFVKKVKAEKCPNDSPIVVHCSAGVGRTGTFIGLDIIMQRLKSENKINIFETVKELRFQRMKMVQSMQQYTFLYTCTFQLVIHKSRKKVPQQKKKVSFQSEQDSDVGTMQQVGVLDAESGSRHKLENIESVM